MTGDVIEFPARRHHDLSEGDVVRLKIGGPLMIVAIADGEVMTEVNCVWIERRRLRTVMVPSSYLDIIARGDAP